MFFSAKKVGFLSHTLRRQTFRKSAVLILRHKVLKFVLSHWSNSLRSEMYPWNSWLIIPKSLFKIKKCFFSEPKLHSYIFKLFLPKRKFFCLIFVTCRLKDDCSNPPGGLTLLKLCTLWKKGKTEKLKSLGAMV